VEVTFASIPLTGPTPIEHSGPIDFPVNPVLDVRDLVRADEPFIASRGNLKSVASFSCMRQYGSLLAAMEARVKLPRSLPLTREGATIVFTQESGGQLLTITATAWLMSVQPELFGTACKFSFAFALKGIATAIINTTTRITENGFGRLTEDGQTRISE
jgi:hypothetical protein